MTNLMRSKQVAATVKGAPTMIKFKDLSRAMKNTLFISLISGSVASCSAAVSNWKEEVLLHDGRKMVVERSQTYGGRSEPGQSGPIREHRMKFAPPGSSQSVTWVSEYGEDIGRTNFVPIAVHLRNQTPYVIASPNLCLSYQKWGRPNPPYVIFEYANGAWKRIPLQELPGEFTTVNLVLSTQMVQAEEMSREGLITSDRVQELNIGAEPLELRRIVRTPLSSKRINEMCPTYPSGPKAPN